MTINLTLLTIIAMLFLRNHIVEKAWDEALRVVSFQCRQDIRRGVPNAVEKHYAPLDRLTYSDWVTDVLSLTKWRFADFFPEYAKGRDEL